LNFGGEVQRASDCPYKKAGINSNLGGNATLNQFDRSTREWSAPRNSDLEIRKIFGNSSSTTPLSSARTHMLRRLLKWHT